MFDLMVEAFFIAFGWPGIIYAFIGVLVGIVFGTLPGLSGAAAVVLLTPVTFGMDPRLAMLLLVSAYGAATYGGAIPAILLNTPGMGPSAATCFDGYPLSQQGKAGMALGAAATSSTLGGFVGLFILVLVIPIIRKILLAFSYPEFFMMVVWGLCMIAVVTKGSTIKGLAAGGLGIMLSLVGYDPVTSVVRYNFGTYYLWNGIPLIPAFIGLLALPEAIHLMVTGGTIVEKKYLDQEMAGVLEGIKAVFKNFPLMLRSAVIGTVIGIIPGVGGTAASFIAYGQAKQTCKNSEKFGYGDIRGVIAPESANDAKEGGAFLPTIAFGIPGSEAMAILLASLTMHGLPTGPQMLDEHMIIVWVLIVGDVVSHMIAAVIGLFCANWVARFITTLRPALFVPIIMAVCLLGSFAMRSEVLDVGVAVVFCFLGYGMRKFDFSRVALIIGFILGELAEISFRQTLMAMDFSAFFLRPISLVVFIITILTFVGPYISSWRSK